MLCAGVASANLARSESVACNCCTRCSDKGMALCVACVCVPLCVVCVCVCVLGKLMLPGLQYDASGGLQHDAPGNEQLNVWRAACDCQSTSAMAYAGAGHQLHWPLNLAAAAAPFAACRPR